jgi:predicted O-methyltransferase YrrM
MARIHYSDEGRTMGADKTTSWSYAEAFAAEDELAYRARERSLALRIPPVTPGTAAALTVLAAAARPATVVEVGTGAGVSGLALLRGLPGTSVLTTIDTDIRALRAARDTFREAGIPTSRTRTIPGRASLVMPRLSAGAYDLVFLDADPEGTLDYAEEAVRLLRPGGMLVVNDALSQDKVAQPANREENTRTMRAVHRLFREDERFSTALLTTGSGLLLAVRR